MDENLIKFENIEWDKPKMGVRQKIYSNGKTRLRLLQFSEDFIEEDWCIKGHVGFVLNGIMRIDFNGTIKRYKKGDGIWINQGDANKHKVMIEKGQHIELILFESEE